MTSRTLFINSACLAALAALVCSATGYANEMLSTKAVGAASVSAPNLLIKLTLTQQFIDSVRVKENTPTIKAVPEPVCKDHHDADKMLILGGAEALPM
jgi:hypothetical protein